MRRSTCSWRPEQARSLAVYATMMADSEDADERVRAMHAAKSEIGKAGKLVGENAIQLHGGVGMTMEYAVGHYFKRMTMIDISLGESRSIICGNWPARAAWSKPDTGAHCEDARTVAMRAGTIRPSRRAK